MCILPKCTAPDLVTSQENPALGLCMTHALVHTCKECGALVTECCIRGCGSWMPVDVDAQAILALEFNLGVEDDRHEMN